MMKPARPEGADASFEAFFHAAFPRAVRAALRITGDRPAAEDAAIEALAKAHVRWARLSGEPWREPWVIRVTVNEAIRRLPRPVPLAVAPSPDDPADAVVLRQALIAALRKLSARQREVIALRYLVGLSEPEVASTLGLSLGSVKTHLRRGLSGLRQTVGRELKEEHLVQLT